MTAYARALETPNLLKPRNMSRHEGNNLLDIGRPLAGSALRSDHGETTWADEFSCDYWTSAELVTSCMLHCDIFANNDTLT